MSKLLAFNISGTLFDKYYLGKTHSFFKTFDRLKLNVPHNIINKYSYYDINTTFKKLLSEEILIDQWTKKYNRYPLLNTDTRMMEEIFNNNMIDCINDIDLIDKKSIDFMKRLNKIKENNYKINIAFYSQYNYNITKTIIDQLSNHINIDYYSCLDYYNLENQNQLYDILINIDKSINYNDIFVIDNTYNGITNFNNINTNLIAILDGSPHQELFTFDNHNRTIIEKNMSTSKKKHLNTLEKYRRDKAYINIKTANPRFIFDNVDDIINQNIMLF